MKVIIIILTLCLTFTREAYGQQDSTLKHSIDKQVEECIKDIIKTKGIVRLLIYVNADTRLMKRGTENLISITNYS